MLSRRAWTRDSCTLFTTTISYRGATDYVTTTGGFPLGDGPPEKIPQDLGLGDTKYGAAPDVQEVDVARLPV